MKALRFVAVGGLVFLVISLLMSLLYGLMGQLGRFIQEGVYNFLQVLSTAVTVVAMLGYIITCIGLIRSNIGGLITAGLAAVALLASFFITKIPSPYSISYLVSNLLTAVTAAAFLVVFSFKLPVIWRFIAGGSGLLAIVAEVVLYAGIVALHTSGNINLYHVINLVGTLVNTLGYLLAISVMVGGIFSLLRKEKPPVVAAA